MSENDGLPGFKVPERQMAGLSQFNFFLQMPIRFMG